MSKLCDLVLELVSEWVSIGYILTLKNAYLKLADIDTVAAFDQSAILFSNFQIAPFMPRNMAFVCSLTM